MIRYLNKKLVKEEDVDYEMDVNLLNETELIIGSNKLESKDLTIKDQVSKLADGPPVDRALVTEIKTKVEQGRYPIDLDLVTEKMFESFKEAEGF